MRSRHLLLPALMLGLVSSLAAHDLFLKLADYLVRPNAPIRITALNGTFTTSENAIERARIGDLTLAGPGGKQPIDTGQVSIVGTRTVIRAQTGAAGTYVMGLSVRPNEITIPAADFNTYLKEEGLGHVLEARRAAGELERGATERYAKHVKVVFQAGAARSDDYGTVLGHPAEVVPLANPYALGPGDTLAVRLLVDGRPAAGIEALAGGRNPAGARLRSLQLRSDGEGVVRIPLRSPGTWYVKFISMTRVTEPKLDYVSQWGTLTFAITRRPLRKGT